MKISIIGTGIYGVALASNIARNNHQITMWSESPELAKSINENQNFTPIIDLPLQKSIKITNNFAECFQSADLIVISSAAKYVRDICSSIKPFYRKEPILIASKGIENTTCMFLSDVIYSILKTKSLAVISGPTFAIDLINKEPCALSLAVTNKKTERLVRMALENPLLKLRSNFDLIGTELCGSIKNVIAIAAGILDGLGFNESTRCFLITESLHDIKELLTNLECNPKTILSFAGIGDLILTCSSSKSRNYQYGKLLGSKKDIETIDNFLNKNTTEGYYTLFSIKELIKNRKIKMPVINVIYDIVINKKDPSILPEFLINKN